MSRIARKSDGLTYWQRQSPLGKAVISIVTWIPLAGFIVGLLFSKVVTSDIGIAVGLSFGALYGLAWVLMIEKGIAESDRNTGEVRNIAANRFLRTAWLRIPFMWLVGFMFGYGAATWGYPWLYNMAFGSPVERLEIVSGFSSGSTRICAHPEIGKLFFANGPRALCIDRSMAGQMAVGTTLRLVGKATVLGINVEQIYIVSNAP